MLFLNVPYSEKDNAKSLGAKWDSKMKKWYVSDRKDYYKFAKWIPNNGNLIVCDYLYLAIGSQDCFKCHKTTRVIAFAVSNYMNLDYIFDLANKGKQVKNEDIEKAFISNDIEFVSCKDSIIVELEEYLRKELNYYKSYSKTTESYYYANHCQNCNVLQGDFFLMHEPDSPFFIDSIKKVGDLFLYQINLASDLIFSGNIIYGSENYLIKKHAKIKEFDFKINKAEIEKDIVQNQKERTGLSGEKIPNHMSFS